MTHLTHKQPLQPSVFAMWLSARNFASHFPRKCNDVSLQRRKLKSRQVQTKEMSYSLTFISDASKVTQKASPYLYPWNRVSRNKLK